MNISWLSYLVFLNPLVGLQYDFSTKHCFALKSEAYVPSCNTVFSTSIPTDDEIKNIKDFFQAAEFNWLAVSNDNGVKDVLIRHDFKKVAQFPVMSKPLDSSIDCEYLPELSVEVADSDNQCIVWMEVMSRAFGASLDHTRIFVSLIKSRLYPAHLKLYLAYYNNIPVATAMIIRHDDVIAISCVGTIELYRKKGISSALIKQALYDARNNDCRTAILFSSHMGESMYTKLGFEVEYMCDSYAL